MHYLSRFRGFVLLLMFTMGTLLPWSWSTPTNAMGLEQQTAASVQIEARLLPSRYVEISPSTAGRIEHVFVEDGQEVQAGDLLLRMDGYEQLLAEIDAARLEMLSAQQAIDSLYRHAGVMLAQASLEVARSDKAQRLASNGLVSLKRSKNPSRIAQAFANMLLAERGLDQARDDLRKAQQKYDNKFHLIWWFINKHQFRLMLTVLESAVSIHERRYLDAQEKYTDLLAPLDEIDLSQAEAELAVASARLDQAKRERRKLLQGPDPDDLRVAQARLKAAESRLAAAEEDARSLEFRAPFSGWVVDVAAKSGEWALAGQRVVTIADFSSWVAETQDLDEFSAKEITPGRSVKLVLDAYPGEEFLGLVESIGLYFIKEDGDVYYVAKIALRQTDPKFRWGMTARLIIE